MNQVSNKTDRPEIAIVVSSCDSFQECWEPFIYSIKTFWKDCQWGIYIISNYKTIESDRVQFLTIGEDKGWASNLKSALSQINAEFIIYMQEDYFLNGTVNTQKIEEHITFCKENKIDYLRLSAPFFDVYQIPNTIYAESPKSKRYRLCLQLSIWNKNLLKQILVEGYTGWQFEWDIEKYIKKNKLEVRSLVLRSEYYPSYSISYVTDTAVHKGMWTQNGYNFIKEHGFDEILKKRDVEQKMLTYLIHNNSNLFRPIRALLLRIMIKFNINI